MATDPICKMNVEEKTAAAKVVYAGKIFYFCSEVCKKAFEKEPKKFAR